MENTSKKGIKKALKNKRRNSSLKLSDRVTQYLDTQGIAENKTPYTDKAFWEKIKEAPSTWIELALSKEKLTKELCKYFTEVDKHIDNARDNIQTYLSHNVYTELHEGDEDKVHDLLPPSVKAGTILYRTSGSDLIEKINKVTPLVNVQEKTASILSSHATIMSGAIIHPIEGQDEENGRTEVTINKKYVLENDISFPKEYQGRYKGDLIGWIATSELKRLKTLLNDVKENVQSIDDASENSARVKMEMGVNTMILGLIPLGNQMKKLMESLGNNSLIDKAVSTSVGKITTLGVNAGTKKGADKLGSLLVKLNKALKDAENETGDSSIKKAFDEVQKKPVYKLIRLMISAIPTVGKITNKAITFYKDLQALLSKMIKSIESYQLILKKIDFTIYEDHPSTMPLIEELRNIHAQESDTINELLQKLRSININQGNIALAEYDDFSDDDFSDDEHELPL